MNELQVFNNPEFGQVRTLTIEDEPWFVGKDVAVALGYENHRKALSDHVDPEDKLQGDGVTIRDPMGREQHPTVINESGLYALIFGSKLESAKRFKHWVTHEVLPAIRKTGTYSLTPKARGLTTDDYMKAAQLAATCRNERLPYVLGFLEQAGFNIPEVKPADQPEPIAVNCAEIDRLMKLAGISQEELSRRTNICKASLSYYRRGIHNPPPDRYKIIIAALT
jgi:prophage antirepressor-like protein